MSNPEAHGVLHGLPPVSYTTGEATVHEIPTEPHVFQADNFVLREIGGTVLANETDVTVLAAHGVVDRGGWYTGSSRTQRTIPELITDLEATGISPDVIFACTESITPKGLSRVLVMNSGRPRVHMRAGHIATGGGIRTIQGRAHLDMVVSSREDVVYEPWLQQRRPKSRIKIIR